MTSPWLLLLLSIKCFLLFIDGPTSNIRSCRSRSSPHLSQAIRCCWRWVRLLNRVLTNSSTISTSSGSNIFCSTWRNPISSLSHWISSLKKRVGQIMDALFQWHWKRCRMYPTVNTTVHLVSIIKIHIEITGS